MGLGHPVHTTFLRGRRRTQKLCVQGKCATGNRLNYRSLLQNIVSFRDDMCSCEEEEERTITVSMCLSVWNFFIHVSRKKSRTSKEVSS